MKKDISKLYQEIILQHNAQPYHYEKRSDASLTLEAYNPLCGDQFQLFIDPSDLSIQNMWFYGYGCAISKASASIMVKQLEGKTWEEAMNLVRVFLELVKGRYGQDKKVDSLDVNPELPEELRAFEVAKRFPTRLTCATLSWVTIESFLQQKK